MCAEYDQTELMTLKEQLLLVEIYKKLKNIDYIVFT